MLSVVGIVFVCLDLDSFCWLSYEASFPMQRPLESSSLHSTSGSNSTFLVVLAKSCVKNCLGSCVVVVTCAFLESWSGQSLMVWTCYVGEMTSQNKLQLACAAKQDPDSKKKKTIIVIMIMTMDGLLKLYTWQCTWNRQSSGILLTHSLRFQVMNRKMWASWTMPQNKCT